MNLEELLVSDLKSEEFRLLFTRAISLGFVFSEQP